MALALPEDTKISLMDYGYIAPIIQRFRQMRSRAQILSSSDRRAERQAEDIYRRKLLVIMTASTFGDLHHSGLNLIGLNFVTKVDELEKRIEVGILFQRDQADHLATFSYALSDA